VNFPTAGTVLIESAMVFGRIDNLVNNAGYLILGVIEEIRSVFVPSLIPMLYEIDA
jgi:NAD(P)-dependent dehydrogenase (short-subunit alcohol dehydrogenase family)